MNEFGTDEVFGIMCEAIFVIYVNVFLGFRLTPVYAVWLYANVF